MSAQIDTALVQQYRSNVEIQFQQMQSRLMPTVTVVPMSAEYEYFDRIGSVEAQEIASRHADTTYTDTPHTRRRIQSKPYFFSDLIDNQDRLRMLADPNSAYVRNAVMAMNRKIDSVIISAALGTAYTGKTGSSTATFDTTNQSVAVDFQIGGGGTNSSLTVDKLLEALKILQENEAIEDGEQLTCVVNAEALQSLLDQTEVKSADYNTVKALVNGSVDTFCGMKFVRSELLTDASGTDDTQVLVYPKSAITLGMIEDTFVEVERLPTKHYSTQVYVRRDFGAVRMWEEKIVRILCERA